MTGACRVRGAHDRGRGRAMVEGGARVTGDGSVPGAGRAALPNRALLARKALIRAIFPSKPAAASALSDAGGRPQADYLVFPVAQAQGARACRHWLTLISAFRAKRARFGSATKALQPNLPRKPRLGALGSQARPKPRNRSLGARAGSAGRRRAARMARSVFRRMPRRAPAPGSRAARSWQQEAAFCRVLANGGQACAAVPVPPVRVSPGSRAPGSQPVHYWQQEGCFAAFSPMEAKGEA